LSDNSDDDDDDDGDGYYNAQDFVFAMISLLICGLSVSIHTVIPHGKCLSQSLTRSQ